MSFASFFAHQCFLYIVFPLFELFIMIHFLFCCSTSLREKKKSLADRWLALPQNLCQSELFSFPWAGPPASRLQPSAGRLCPECDAWARNRPAREDLPERGNAGWGGGLRDFTDGIWLLCWVFFFFNFFLSFSVSCCPKLVRSQPANFSDCHG